jgi:hypothetical protein
LQGSLDAWLQEKMNILFPLYQSPSFRPHVTLLGDIHGEEQQVISVADSLFSEMEVDVNPILTLLQLNLQLAFFPLSPTHKIVVGKQTVGYLTQ